MFSIALSLAIGASAPNLAASGAAIAVSFAPEDDCAAFDVRAINNAEGEILVGAYGLTTGSGIVEALVRAKERGVDVRLIPGRLVRTDFVGPSQCWDSWTRLPRGGLRAEPRRARSQKRRL